LIYSLTLWRLPSHDRALERIRNLQNPTFVRDRINKREAITTTEVTHLALDGGEIASLNFNNVVATQNVNYVSIKRGFQ
jgi:hypothetical protein